MPAPVPFTQLRKLLAFDPRTGQFAWLVSPNKRTPAGTIAGGITCHGYICITINGNKLGAHRLAWRFTHGTWPTKFIDHIDGNRQNNRPENLRDVSRRVNAQNRKGARRGSTSGVLGVRKSLERWTARINIRGKDVHLGSFDTKELAYAAYVEAKRRHHPGCTL